MLRCFRAVAMDIDAEAVGDPTDQVFKVDSSHGWTFRDSTLNK
jgi:hypothetical protein